MPLAAASWSAVVPCLLAISDSVSPLFTVYFPAPPAAGADGVALAATGMRNCWPMDNSSASFSALAVASVFVVRPWRSAMPDKVSPLRTV